LITYNFSENMIYRENPQSIVSQIVTPDPEYLNLTESGYFMAFGLQDLRNYSIQYIDESIYTVQMIERTKIGTNITLQYIPLSRCSLERVPDMDDLRDYFQRNQINNLYCIDDSSQITPSLQSTWDGPLYKNILINIFPCINSTDGSGIICKDSDMIEGFLNSGNFAMYFTNMAIDPNNFGKPLTSFGKEFYTPISFSTLTYIEMLFGHASFESDNGLITENLDSRNLANYLSSRQVLTFSSDMVVQIDMKLDKVKTTYSRSYDKIQTVMGNVGGVIQIFSLVANFLILPFVKHQFQLGLSNSIFNFKIPKQRNENQKKPTIFQKTKKFFKNNFLALHLKTSVLNENQIVKNYFNPQSKKLQVGYFGCFNKNSKVEGKLFDSSLKKIHQMLDLSYVMNKMEEVDHIKMLLLDQTQKNLLEYIPKPEISLDIDKEKDIYSVGSFNATNKFYLRSNTEKAKLAYDAFLVISKKEKKSVLDEKLLEMVPKLKKVERIFEIIHPISLNKNKENNHKGN